MRTRLACVLCLALLTSVPLLASAAPSEPAKDASMQVLRETGRAFSEIAKQAMPAVVSIQVELSQGAGPAGEEEQGGPDLENPFDQFNDEFLRHFFGGRMPKSMPHTREIGQGSGFIISKDGYILSNHHAVGDAKKITVKLYDGREFTAKKIGSDPHSDVALIKIEATDLPTLTLGDSDTIDIGEWAIAVGSPFGLSATLTVGVISAKGRNNIGITDYEDFIQTDAAINPGNSGGPLLNASGEVIGMTSAIFSRSGGYMGIGFAVPINMVKTIKDQLMKTGRVERGYIGILIQPLTEDLSKSFGLAPATKGILIARVNPGSPGDRAGLKEGDVILKLNGTDVKSVPGFRNEIALMKPGSEVSLTISRDRKTQDVRVKTGLLDEKQAGGPGGEDAAGAVQNQLGVVVNDLTPELAKQLGYDVNEGVLIAQVKHDSPADTAGLEPGQLVVSVNRQPVKTAEEFNKAVADVKPGEPVLLLVKDKEGGSRFVAITLEPQKPGGKDELEPDTGGGDDDQGDEEP